MKSVLVTACLLAATIARAQPAPPAPATDKGDARALVASGLKLYAAKDYLGALAVFKGAYARFPSTKILLNIGTTLRALGRKAEAANTYQRYLDASDTDATRKPEVERVLVELDRHVGIVEVAVTPDGAQVKVGDDDWVPALRATRYRVPPGSVVVSARHADYALAAKSIEVEAGTRVQVALALVAMPLAAASSSTSAATSSSLGLQARGVAVEAPSRLGAIAFAHVDPQFEGAAALVGLSYVAIGGVQVEAAALLGGTFGGYAGARYAFLRGLLRPTVAAGVPIFVSNGARFGVRAAGGIELAIHRHLSLVAELGVEHVFNPEPAIASTLIVPAIGAIGRL